jgi:predicted RNA-binding protein with PIN domain
VLLVDGNNVMGSRPDGWWRDRAAGMRRVVARLEALGREDVVVVFDGPPRPGVASGTVAVVFAPDADDELARRAAAAGARATVVTSDRGLRARVERTGAFVRGARTLP